MTVVDTFSNVMELKVVEETYMIYMMEIFSMWSRLTVETYSIW